MGFLDTLLGRTKPVKPNLDALFALPSAAITLETEAGLQSTGTAAVCFKPSSSGAFTAATVDLNELLASSLPGTGTKLNETDDAYGYHWVVLSDPDLEDLVGGVHLVNSTLEERGFGPQLLCSTFAFGDSAGKLVLVYLYKRGTFYPFAPQSGERRNSELELRIRGVLSGDQLPVEQDLSRWFPVWGVPLGN